MKKSFLLFCAMAVSFPLFAGDDKPISTDRLPAPAKEFIGLHFKDIRVSLATVDKELFDTTYEVFFADGCKVEFDRGGQWREVDCQHACVPEGAVPEAIGAYIASNHPGCFVREIDRDTHDYEVTLDNGIELKFDLRFRLIGIDN